MFGGLFFKVEANKKQEAKKPQGDSGRGSRGGDAPGSTPAARLPLSKVSANT